MKLFKPTLVALALVAVVGCNEKTVAVEKAPVLETEIQKQAYALGASFGIYAQRSLEMPNKLGLTLDKELIINGFNDSLAGKAVFEKEEIGALMQNFEAAMKEKQQAAAIAAAEASLVEGAKFLEENAKKEGVQVTESGLQYSVITAAEGDKPLATDTVKVNYKGTFLNGETFDSSYDRGQPIEFPLNGVIKGWTEGVQLMSVGEKYKFTIPSELAYGPQGNQGIPGNSVLQFEVELLEIVQPEAAPAPAAMDEHGHAPH